MLGRFVRSVILISLLLMLVCFNAFAQKRGFDGSSRPAFFERIYTGGGFGFSSSSSITTLSLSPLVGYMITQKLSAGVGIQYQYYNNRFINADDHRYGGKVFAMQMLVHRLFLYSEYNFLNLNRQPQIETNPRETVTRFLVGGGFSQPLGKASFNFMVLYDLSYGNSSPYASPVVIGGFLSI